MSRVNRRAALKVVAAGGLTAAAAGPAAAQPFPGRQGRNFGLDIIRVEGTMRMVRGNHMLFFVDTGSDAPPVGSLADNNGFPTVAQAYFKGAALDRGRRGVVVSVFFTEAPARGVALAVNILQAGGFGDNRVYPLH